MVKESPIWKVINELKERVLVLEGKFATSLLTPESSIPTSELPRPETLPPKSEVPHYPTPIDFIEMVDLTLNKNFGIKYEPLPDSPSFQFTIIIPPKYSPNKPITDLNGKLVQVEDVRTKVISNSDGVNGVREWAEKVLKNFDPDTQFRIVEDRPFANRPI